MRGWCAAVAAVSAIGLLSGCGGGGSDDGGLTRAQLNARTGALCKDANRRFAAIAQPDLTDAAQAAPYMAKVSDLADEEVAKLRALHPDSALKAAYTRYISAIDASRAMYARVAAKARAKDPSGLQELQQEIQQHTLNDRAVAAARKAGLKTCADLDEGAKHVISVHYAQPQSQMEQQVKELLELGGTNGVAEGFSKNFAFPVDVAIDVNRGDASPFYDPSTKTVNLSYGFVNETAGIIRHGEPHISDAEFGKQMAAIDGFILVHELGHMFVDVFEIPITGREEDAVDGMATVFFTDAVPNGLEYAFDAARFFRFLQDFQGKPDVRQFQDEHGLSIQRAYDIVCSVAGASEASMRAVAQLGILSSERLQRCPAEYQQKSRSWKALLQPHLRQSS